MPFPSVTNLGQLSGAVLDEFLHFYAQLEGYLRKEHKDDGSHGVLHADALTLTEDPKTGATGDLTMDGDLTANGETHVLGPVDITTAAAGAQVTLSDSWRIQRGAASSPLSEDWALEILDLDRNTSVPVIELGYYSPASAYVVFPRATGLALGFKDGSSVDRLTYVATQAVYEVGHSSANGAAQTYTPGWTATVNPAIGNGTLSGRYAYLSGSYVHLNIVLTAGSTTTFGSDLWKFALPVTAAHTNYTGVVRIRDSGTDFYVGTVEPVSTTLFAIALESGAGVRVSALAPMTWTSGDGLWIDLVYESA